MLNFKATKPGAGSSKSKSGSPSSTPAIRKSSSLKNVIRAESSSDDSSDEEIEPEVPPSLVKTRAATKEVAAAASVSPVPRAQLNLRKYNKLYGQAREKTNGLPLSVSLALINLAYILIGMQFMPGMRTRSTTFYECSTIHTNMDHVLV